MTSYRTDPPRHVTCLAVLLLSQAITVSLFADIDTNTLGLVADKPSEGRFVKTAGGYMSTTTTGPIRVSSPICSTLAWPWAKWTGASMWVPPCSAALKLLAS